MNLAHLKYAVEVAEAGSINKASEKLYVSQPNLSRAIKELEGSLGVNIFDRSSKGMELTPDGEVFVRYAKSILKQVDAVEDIFHKGEISKKRFSISVPRASYISDAFARFSNVVNEEKDVEVFYEETNSLHAIKNILQGDYKLGIVRYAESYDKYYKKMMAEKGLNYELITEFRYHLIFSKKSPLSKNEKITFSDLEKYIEIAHSDPFVPSLPFNEVKKEELPDDIRRRIFVFERASQFELLSQNPNTFIWVSPVPLSLLERYDLTQKNCEENERLYKDILIYRSDYSLSELDNLFISELCKSRREVFG